MRFLILLQMIFFFEIADSQNLNFQNSILIFKNIDPIADTSLSEDSWYCFIDKNNFIHFSSEPFRINDEGYAYDDTIKVGDSSIVKAVMGFIPHRIINVFKYAKEGDRIIMVRQNDLHSKNRRVCFDTEYTSYTSNSTFFSNKDEKYATAITKLVNKDTVINFNNLKFPCWKYEERYKHYQEVGHYYFFIDKRYLIPIGFEVEESMYDDTGKQRAKTKKYMLFGILQLNGALTKGLHIWGDAPLK